MSEDVRLVKKLFAKKYQVAFAPLFSKIFILKSKEKNAIFTTVTLWNSLPRVLWLLAVSIVSELQIKLNKHHQNLFPEGLSLYPTYFWEVKPFGFAQEHNQSNIGSSNLNQEYWMWRWCNSLVLELCPKGINGAERIGSAFVRQDQRQTKKTLSP